MLVDAGFRAADTLLIVDMAGELVLGPFLPGAPEKRDGAVDSGRPLSVLDGIAEQRRKLMPVEGIDSGAGPEVDAILARIVADDPRAWLRAELCPRRARRGTTRPHRRTARGHHA